MTQGPVKAGIVAATLALAGLGGWWATGPGRAAAPPPLAGERAELAARRADVAFADAQAVWAARFRAELGRVYAPTELRHFARATESACVAPRKAVGPHYCDATGVAAADLAFLDGLGRRLRNDAERAAALFVARLSAAHAAAQLGLSDRPEAADCLAGVWARDAAARIGPVAPDLYGRMLTSAREVLRETGGDGAHDARLFAHGERTLREAGFARGLAAGEIVACTG